jgi:hypothetical protein
MAALASSIEAGRMTPERSVEKKETGGGGELRAARRRSEDC